LPDGQGLWAVAGGACAAGEVSNAIALEAKDREDADAVKSDSDSSDSDSSSGNPNQAQPAQPGGLDEAVMVASKKAKTSQAKAKALATLRENLRVSKEMHKQTKAELKDATKELKDLENKFKRWRARNPSKGLAKAFDSLPHPVPEEKMKEFLQAFAVESKLTESIELLSDQHVDTQSRESIDGKRYVDYHRICLYYGLQAENIDDAGEDLTYAKLAEFEKLGWISKQKVKRLLKGDCRG